MLQSREMKNRGLAGELLGIMANERGSLELVEEKA
jgi:hypothetical protein